MKTEILTLHKFPLQNETEHCKLLMQYTLLTDHRTLHTAHCTLHTAHWTLHTAHCTLHTAHCTLHTKPTHYTTARWRENSFSFPNDWVMGSQADNTHHCFLLLILPAHPPPAHDTHAPAPYFLTSLLLLLSLLEPIVLLLKLMLLLLLHAPTSHIPNFSAPNPYTPNTNDPAQALSAEQGEGGRWELEKRRKKPWKIKQICTTNCRTPEGPAYRAL